MEGYWLTHYVAGTARGDGIAMLHAGELVGGDLEHLWKGTWEEEGPRVSARIRIVPCVSRAEEESMAREQPFIVTLRGYCTEHYARLQGHAEGRQDLPFEVTMRKCRASRPAPSPVTRPA
jgi:hypothetical protein